MYLSLLKPTTPMFVHKTQIRVRYAETDQMGYAYYGNYATYYEVARVEALRAAGLSYKVMEESGIMMPVLENHAKYIAPAMYDEVLTIETTIAELPTARITFRYAFYNEAGKLIHTGETLLCFMRKDTRRPCRLPEEFLTILQPHFGQND